MYQYVLVYVVQVVHNYLKNVVLYLSFLDVTKQVISIPQLTIDQQVVSWNTWPYVRECIFL